MRGKRARTGSGSCDSQYARSGDEVGVQYPQRVRRLRSETPRAHAVAANTRAPVSFGRDRRRRYRAIRDVREKLSRCKSVKVRKPWRYDVDREAPDNEEEAERLEAMCEVKERRRR